MKQKFLLASDLDGTLLGPPDVEARFRAWATANRERFVLCYATGRSQASVQGLIDEGRLLEPDYVLGHIGTTLKVWSGEDKALAARLTADVAAHWKASHVLALGAEAGLTPQEPEHNNAYKASFYWDGEAAPLEGLHQRLSAAWPQGGWKAFDVAGQYVDVLPEALGKGPSVRKLAQHLGIPLDQVLVAGDTENDLDFFFEPGFKAVLPANALPGLRRRVQGRGHYESTLNETEAVLDALEHFGWR